LEQTKLPEVSNLVLLIKRKEKKMDVEAAKMIGAGLAVIALAGVGVGIGSIFSSLVSSIARNPAARDTVFGIGILGFALTEAIALFALVVALLMLFAL
jgi:F-type H+-transporting ATPase subunit c